MYRAWIGCFLIVASSQSLAVDGGCSSLGRLSYLGGYTDGSGSVWLSRTNGGVRWRVQAEQDPSLFADEYQKTGSALHISVSPVAVFNAAGEHGLYEVSGDAPCLLNTAQQEVGIGYPVLPSSSSSSGGGSSSGGSSSSSGGGSSSSGGGGSSSGGYDLGDLAVGLQQLSTAGRQQHASSISDRVVSNYFGRHSVDEDSKIVELKDGRGVNLWLSRDRVGLEDDRNNIDRNTDLDGWMFGADLKTQGELYIGLAFSAEDIRDRAFGDSLKQDVKGFYGGPYLGLQLSDRWIADIWLGYGTSKTDSHLSVLTGDIDSEQYFTSMNLTGQYWWQGLSLRPRASLFYAQGHDGDFSYRIDCASCPAGRIAVDDQKYRFGSAQLSLDSSYLFDLSDTTRVEPFLRLSVRNDFERPVDGSVLYEWLDIDEPSRWAGSSRLGVRLYTLGALELELSGGYDSLGVDKLDIWDTRFAVNWFIK